MRVSNIRQNSTVIRVLWFFLFFRFVRLTTTDRTEYTRRKSRDKIKSRDFLERIRQHVVSSRQPWSEPERTYEIFRLEARIT